MCVSINNKPLQFLLTKQDATVQRMLVDMKLKQRAKIEKGMEQLLETRKSATHGMGFYMALTGGEIKIPDPGSDANLRLTYHEMTELDYSDSASVYNK